MEIKRVGLKELNRNEQSLRRNRNKQKTIDQRRIKRAGNSKVWWSARGTGIKIHKLSKKIKNDFENEQIFFPVFFWYGFTVLAKIQYD